MIQILNSELAYAQPSCGQTVTMNITLSVDLDCSGSNSHGLEVGANGITINLNGKKLIGNKNSNFSGIISAGFKNIKITNGTIVDFQAGILITGGGSNITINRIHTVQNLYSGIVIVETSGILISNTLSETNGVDGISCERCAGLTLRSVQANNNRNNGAGMLYQSGATITNFSARGNYLYGLVFGDGGNQASAPTGTINISQSVFDGRELGGDTIEQDVGLLLYCFSKSTVNLQSSTALYNSTDGFSIYNCTNPWSTTKSLISGNTSQNNGQHGFSDAQSSGASFTNNVADSNLGKGFAFIAPQNIIIKSNTATNNVDVGFYAETSATYRVTSGSSNIATGNGSYGFSASSYAVPGSGNFASNNNNSGIQCTYWTCIK